MKRTSFLSMPFAGLAREELQLMNHFLSLSCILFLFPAAALGQPLKGYYTRLGFDDSGFSGKYADVVIELKDKGKVVFSREYSYQPFWQANGKRPVPVDRLIPRKGDGPEERPDKHNICSNASIVGRAETAITVHWRYAPDLLRPSFVDYRSAYNQAGNPSAFYGEYADEYFTIHANGTVVRTVKKGCYRLEEWKDPRNRIEQTLQLTPDGIRQTSLRPAQGAALEEIPIAGEPVKAGPIAGPVRQWTFDEGRGPITKERNTDTECPILGVHAYWRKGVSGTCLSFDSYSNAVVLPASQCPAVKGAITLSAWIAPQEYPFNWAAIVDHLNGAKGYFLGINAKGEIGFKVGQGDSVAEAVTSPIPLYEWTHIAAVYTSRSGICIYLNGAPATAVTPASGSIVDAGDADLSIGMTRSFRQFPSLAERKCTKLFETNMVFSGLIDEVEIFDRALVQRDLAAAYHAFRPSGQKPLQPWVLPAGPERSPGFGAEYTHLKYSPEWDGLWRVGDYADIVVTFDDTPWRYVFWRGTRYLPSLVTGFGPGAIWSSDQGPEHYNGQCHEHMSDMLCRFSNARLIHSSEARTVVHWRNASVSIDYKWPMTDGEGWGIWTDEYWTIYPDGVSIRHQVVHNNTGKRITGELNQNEVLHQPGQTTEDVLNDAALIIASTDGGTETRYRSAPQRRTLPENWNLQYLNLKGETKQFEIGEIGARSRPLLHSDVYWKGWNHYPVQLIPSDGTRIQTYDRPASTCPATFYEIQHKVDEKTLEAMVMYGLTRKKPEDLIHLNRSWNHAPEVIDVEGCQYRGYEKRERAFQFAFRNKAVKFTIRATRERPLENPAFVIANWGSNDRNVFLKIDGRAKTRGPDYKAGMEVDTDGTYALVIWMDYSSTETVSFEIAKH